jgi:hypothetical protein
VPPPPPVVDATTTFGRAPIDVVQIRRRAPDPSILTTVRIQKVLLRTQPRANGVNRHSTGAPGRVRRDIARQDSVGAKHHALFARAKKPAFSQRHISGAGQSRVGRLPADLTLGPTAVDLSRKTPSSHATPPRSGLEGSVEEPAHLGHQHGVQGLLGDMLVCHPRAEPEARIRSAKKNIRVLNDSLRDPYYRRRYNGARV